MARWRQPRRPVLSGVEALGAQAGGQFTSTPLGERLTLMAETRRARAIGADDLFADWALLAVNSEEPFRIPPLQ